MKRKILIPLAILVVIIAAIAIYFTQKPKEPETIKIGAILPLTGPSGVLGQSVMSGMSLAFEDFNKKYSTNYVLDIQDTQGEPKQAVNIYQRNKSLYKTPIVLSWMSSAASALVGLTEIDRRVLFVGAAKSSLTESGYKYIIRVFPNASDLSFYASKYIGEILKPSKIGIYYINDDYGKDVGEKFISNIQKYKLKVSFFEPVDAKATNYKDYVIKHKQDGVDLIYLVVYGPLYPGLIKEIRQYLGFVKIFADITFANYNTQQEIGDLGDGIYTIATYADDINTDWEPAKSFQLRIWEKYKLKADFNSALGYDMAWIALEAHFNSENKTSDEIIQYITQKSAFEGVSGKLVFEKNGNVKCSLNLLVREQGVLKKVEIK
jgi:branched-chain amino acid transport system substrate-binding protein